MASPETPEGKETPTERPLIMRYAARSDVGRIRSKNDDSAYVGRHLAVVADGMGGHAGGDVASASTVLDMIHLDHDDYPEGPPGLPGRAAGTSRAQGKRGAAAAAPRRPASARDQKRAPKATPAWRRWKAMP